ncbi:MAG: protein phosphatase 2C domain-containing protein [Bacteroidales bacterium]|nr:protein phosphatase 2C domain-containing protein [Bacteroidales bacterium]
MEQIETWLLCLLRKAGIQPTQSEIDYFESSLAKKMWDKVMGERMDKKLIIKNAVEGANIYLPNGRVGEDYYTEVQFDIEGVKEYRIEGLEKVGLTYEKRPGGFVVKGTAMPEGEEGKKGGDFPLRLVYTTAEDFEEEAEMERKLTLILNPDPRTLWKNIPTPTNIRYPKADSDKDYVKVPEVNGEARKDIVAASQRGRSHAHEGKPRDDDFKIRYCEESDWYVIAVADGAGSAQYSRRGSEIACNTVMEHCSRMLSESMDFDNYIRAYKESQTPEAWKDVSDYVYRLLGAAAHKAHNAIKAEAEGAQDPKIKMRDYSTTLLLAVSKKFEFGWVVASFWVGDGAICVYDQKNHRAEMLGMPDEGEYAGQTRFLTMPEIFSDTKALYGRLRFKIYEDFTALMLMTDGVSDPKFTTDANLQNVDKWDALWADLKENGVELTDDNEAVQDQLLEWLNFWDRGNHDDRTIAILY